MSIDREIEEMAAQMADNTNEVAQPSLEDVILELGPEGLKKALPNLAPAQVSLLKSTLTDMVKKGVKGLDSVVASTEEGEMEWNLEKLHQSEQDEEVADQAEESKMQVMRNQGGVPIEGWEGQIIGEGETELSMTDPSDIQVPDIMKAKKESCEDEAEEAVEEHEEKMHKKDKKMAKSVAKENFIALVKRMQDRKLEKSVCVPALAKKSGISEVLLDAAWEEIAKSYAEAKMELDAKVQMQEKDQSEMPEQMKKEMKGEKVPTDASVPAPRTDIKKEGAEVDERMKGGNSAQTADEGEMPPSTMKKSENWDEVPGVNKYENKKKQKEDKETDIGGMSTTTADAGEMPPKTLKKAESFWYEEEEVYEAPAQDIFKSNTYGKNANYTVDEYIVQESEALTESLKKSTFLYESGEEVLEKSDVLKNSEDYIEAGLDMDASVLEVAQANLKSEAQGGFLVKSFADEEMDALFKSQDMWAEDIEGEDLEKGRGKDLKPRKKRGSGQEQSSVESDKKTETSAAPKKIHMDTLHNYLGSWQSARSQAKNNPDKVKAQKERFEEAKAYAKEKGIPDQHFNDAVAAHRATDKKADKDYRDVKRQASAAGMSPGDYYRSTMKKSFYDFFDGEDIEDAEVEADSLGKSEELEKAEGSRGGKVIGHTKSGKPIYEAGNKGKTKGWTAQDHKDALGHHAVEASERSWLSKPGSGRATDVHREHAEKRDHHNSLVDFHEEEMNAEKKK